MADLLQALIRDTLVCLKDPLFPRQTLFATAEECSLFQQRPKDKRAAPAPPPPPAPPFREMAAPSFVVRPAQQAPPKQIEAPRPTPPLKEPKPQAKTPPETGTATRLKATLQKIAPALQLTDAIPDDTEAKRIAGAFADKIPDADVILLACKTDADTTEFLNNLARAIDQHLGRTKILPAHKLEQQQRWDLFLQMNSFKLIVASDGIEQLPSLKTFYRADPPRLDQIPLLALSSSVVYKSIEHKANLWKTLCQILGK